MDKCKDGGNRQRGYPLMQDMTERVMAQCVSKKTARAAEYAKMKK